MLDTSQSLSLIHECPTFSTYDFTVQQEQTGNRILKLINLEEMFSKAPDPVVLNEYDFTAPGYAEVLNSKLFSKAGPVAYVASCACGKLKEDYFRGRICPVCHTPVISDMEAESGHLLHRVWISAPDVPLRKGETRDVYDPNREIYWMHPHIYRVLVKWLHYGRKSETNFLDDILNPYNKLHPDLAPFIKGRGFRYFYENFDKIMWTFCNEFKPTSKKNPQLIWHFIQENRDKIFCRHLPVLASALHPIVSADPNADPSKTRHFVDESSKYILEAANGLSFLTHATWMPRKRDDVDEAVWQAYKSYIEYNEIIIATRLSRKKSLMRQHLFGARFHQSARAVIVPIVGQHDYDELHMPWTIMVNMLRPMLTNRLLRRGYDINTIYERFHHAMFGFDVEIYQILNDLIKECPYKGIPVLFNRNPSLKRGSIQMLYITRVIPDVEDNSIRMSVLVLRDQNADFDCIWCLMLVFLE